MPQYLASIQVVYLNALGLQIKGIANFIERERQLSYQTIKQNFIHSFIFCPEIKKRTFSKLRTTKEAPYYINPSMTKSNSAIRSRVFSFLFSLLHYELDQRQHPRPWLISHRLSRCLRPILLRRQVLRAFFLSFITKRAENSLFSVLSLYNHIQRM